jgi:hypothetical protein
MPSSIERPERGLKIFKKIGATSACVACVCDTQQDAVSARAIFDVRRPQPSMFGGFFAAQGPAP